MNENDHRAVVVVISEEQVAHYRDHGFVVVEDPLTSTQCTRLNRYANDVMKGVHPLPRGDGIWMDRAAIDKASVKEDQRNPGYLFKIGHLMHRPGNNHTDRRRRALVLHYADAQSRWLAAGSDAVNPFLLVCGREYPGCL